MSLSILADENVDFRIVCKLLESGYEVISVLRKYQGSSDKQVIELAKHHKAILLTEDSDFGEWVFAHKEQDLSVIFLRYNHTDILKITDSVIKILTEKGDSLFGSFTVVTVKKIRIRNIK